MASNHQCLLLLQLRSRATSGRSVICPEGNKGYTFVASGNLLLSRTMMLLLVASCRGCRFLLEQPGQSCMSLHPRWNWFVDRVSVAFLDIGSFDFFGLIELYIYVMRTCSIFVSAYRFSNSTYVEQHSSLHSGFPRQLVYGQIRCPHTKTPHGMEQR